MKLNRRGCTRLVIVLKTKVIKIPNFTYSWLHFVKGIVANFNENTTWKYNNLINRCDKSYLLCPVVWCSWGGWVLVMERAEIINREDWDNINIEEHIKYFAGDDTLGNYGILNNKVVKIDYGS